MSKALKPLLAMALSAVLAGPLSAEEISADTVVARVGDTDITLGHMVVMRAQLPPEYQQLPDDVLYEAVLDQLIRQTAIVKGKGEDLSLGARLALENEQRSYVAGEALARIAEAAVTDEALQKAYDETYADAAPTKEYSAAHILVETEEKAREIREKLDAGADFAELAREASGDPAAANGGDLGWFGEGMMVKPFEEAVLALEPGQISEPVQTDFGWHVIRLNETRLKEVPALEEVRDQLVQQIQGAAMEAALEEATAATEVTRTEIEIDPAVLSDRSLVDK